MPKYSFEEETIYKKYHNAPLYKHLIKNGKSHKQAIKGFSELEKLISEQRAEHYGFPNTKFYQNLLKNEGIIRKLEQ